MATATDFLKNGNWGAWVFTFYLEEIIGYKKYRWQTVVGGIKLDIVEKPSHSELVIQRRDTNVPRANLILHGSAADHRFSQSPLSRRIVCSFLDFLSSVEPCPRVNVEGIETARQRLEKAFQLTDDDHRIKPVSLVEMFNDKGQDPTGENHEGESRLGTLSSALERTCQIFSRKKKPHHYKPLPDRGDSEDPVKSENAAKFIHDAINEMDTSGCEKMSPKYLAQLAETLKEKGDKAMELKQHTKAVVLYDCSIAFCESNAIYHCNRAAAYTKIHKYNEAIRDCLKSIEIDPNYSKAYGRLGVAYYAVGNYHSAIDKGFKKALQLDPKNEAAKKNIQVAQLRLTEQQQPSKSHYSQKTSSSFSLSISCLGSGSNIHDASNTGSVPADFANMFTNMGVTAYQGQHPEHKICNTIVNGGIHLPKTASPMCRHQEQHC